MKIIGDYTGELYLTYMNAKAFPELVYCMTNSHVEAFCLVYLTAHSSLTHANTGYLNVLVSILITLMIHAYTWGQHTIG